MNDLDSHCLLGKFCIVKAAFTQTDRSHELSIQEHDERTEKKNHDCIKLIHIKQSSVIAKTSDSSIYNHCFNNHKFFMKQSSVIAKINDSSMNENCFNHHMIFS